MTDNTRKQATQPSVMENEYMLEIWNDFGFKIVRYDQLEDGVIKDRLKSIKGDYVLHRDDDEWCLRHSDIVYMWEKWKSDLFY